MEIGDVIDKFIERIAPWGNDIAKKKLRLIVVAFKNELFTHLQQTEKGVCPFCGDSFLRSTTTKKYCGYSEGKQCQREASQKRLKERKKRGDNSRCQRI